MKAMMRDASWYACPGRADVYHVVVEIKGQFFPACNTTLRHGHMAGHKGVILNEQTKIDARDARMRCERSGCKQKWPPILAVCTAKGCEKPIARGTGCRCRDCDHEEEPRHAQCCGGPNE